MPEALTQRQRKLDARSLVALAHPLRIRLRNELRRSGPATASQLARRFGESSGSTSYHLRMLARHGFIEPDEDHGKGRERWWRAAPEVLMIGSELSDDPTTREALRVLTTEVHAEAEQHLRRWLEEGALWSEAWRRGSELAVYLARLSATQMADLHGQLEAVIGEFIRTEPADGARTVELHFNLFPLGDPE